MFVKGEIFLALFILMVQLEWIERIGGKDKSFTNCKNDVIFFLMTSVAVLILFSPWLQEKRKWFKPLVSSYFVIAHNCVISHLWF